ADELQKERDRKTSQVEKLTRELERDIEGFTKAFESLWHRARRGPARESLERTFKSLLSAYWRGRTLTADIEHLQNLDARLQSTLILSMNYLRECLRNSSFPDFDEDDIYIKTEVVTEVLSSPHVAESAYRAMKEKGAGSESLLTGARHRIRSVLGHFSVDRIMSFVEEGRELTPKLTTLWGIALRKEMLRSLEGNFTGLLDISVWDAIAREAQENGREIASYVSDLLARTSRKAAPFVSLVNTAGPQKHGYVLYNKPAWEKFYTDKLGGGGKKAPKLHDYLSGGGSGEDLLGSEQESGGDEEKNLEVKTLDPRLPGNPYEVMFFSVLAGFVPDELDRNQVWKDSAVWAQQQKGREIFLDTGITEKAVSQDRQNYARLIFLLAEQFKLIESAGAVYKYRKNNLETGLRGREAVIQWFVSEASQTRLAVAADLTEEWRQHPPKNRKELFTKLRKSLESKRDNPKTPKYLKEVYAADVKIVDWAIEQDAYSTAAFTF
ncbi:MAG: hypothetical protein FJY85_07065, partial [Deltaproteobacteria bacterium]|nr:hypothetical protein [Deltaproteobacteria bacterium]